MVQGVGFRYWTERNARELGLDGWVRNNLDGTVEALFSGQPENVDEMFKRCAEGPPYAEVTAVEIVSEDECATDGFKILSTV